MEQPKRSNYKLIWCRGENSTGAGITEIRAVMPAAACLAVSTRRRLIPLHVYYESKEFRQKWLLFL